MCVPPGPACDGVLGRPPETAVAHPCRHEGAAIARKPLPVAAGPGWASPVGGRSWQPWRVAGRRRLCCCPPLRRRVDVAPDRDAGQSLHFLRTREQGHRHRPRGPDPLRACSAIAQPKTMDNWAFTAGVAASVVGLIAVGAWVWTASSSASTAPSSRPGSAGGGVTGVAEAVGQRAAEERVLEAVHVSPRSPATQQPDLRWAGAGKRPQTQRLTLCFVERRGCQRRRTSSWTGFLTTILSRTTMPAARPRQQAPGAENQARLQVGQARWELSSA